MRLVSEILTYFSWEMFLWLKKGPFCHLHAKYYKYHLYELIQLFVKFLYYFGTVLLKSVCECVNVGVAGPHLPSCLRHFWLLFWCKHQRSRGLWASADPPVSYILGIHQAFVLFCFKLLWGFWDLNSWSSHLHICMASTFT